jgi:hypothetical protein
LIGVNFLMAVSLLMGVNFFYSRGFVDGRRVANGGGVLMGVRVGILKVVEELHGSGAVDARSMQTNYLGNFFCKIYLKNTRSQ